MYDNSLYNQDEYNGYQTASLHDKLYDADIFLVLEVPYFADIDILAQDIDALYNADIDLQEAFDASYNADIDLKKTIDVNYLSDIYLIKVDNNSIYSADISLRSLTDSGYDADIDLQKTYDINYSVDIDLQEAFDKTYNADTLLYKTFNIDYNADILLYKTLDGSYAADIDLQDTLNVAYNSDVFLKSFDVSISYSGTIILLEEKDVVYSGDLSLSQVDNNISYSADVVLRHIINTSYNADILLDKTLAYSADTYIAFNYVPGDWPNRRNISINPDDVEDNPHTDFPVLLILEAGGINDDWGDLATTLFADIGTTKAEAINNVIFTNSTGTAKYAHEIAYFSNTADKKYMECYVKIPSLTVNTCLRMLHKDDGTEDEQDIEQTWSNGYKGVWHLTEQNDGTASGSAIYLDSTLNNNDGADYVSDITKAEKLGLAQQFDGNDDYINVGNNSSLDLGTDDFTLSAWVKTPDVVSVERGVICKNAGGIGEGLFFSVGVDGKLFFNLPLLGDFEESNTELDGDSWHYVIVQRSGNDILFYLDGVADGSRTNFFLSVDLSNTNNVVLGRQCGNIALDGSLEEVRISSICECNSGWIETEYNSQNDNDSFWDVGPGEATVVGASYYGDVDIKAFSDSAYHADVFIHTTKYSFVDQLARKILSLNADNKVNVVGFNSEYIEIILVTKSGSTTTINTSETSHSLQIEATVNILDKANHNDATATRTAVPDDTIIAFEVVSADPSSDTVSAMVNPITSKTINGKAETSLVVLTPIGTDKVDVFVRAYTDQF